MKNSEISSLMKQRMEELDVMSGKLEDLMNKIKEASTTLLHYSNQVKSKKLLVKYYNTKLPTEGKEKSTSDVLCNAIKNALSFLKGKHSTTKAKLLVEGLMSGNIFQGEVAKALQENTRQRIWTLFRPWKLVKAGDVCSVGGFKTTTINALCTIVDENGEGFFPSPSTVNRSRALLDKYGAECVGYTQRNTKYGEVYYLNHE
jgi:hypothetical protein